MKYTKSNWKWKLTPFYPHEIVVMGTVVCIALSVFVLVTSFIPKIFLPYEPPADPLTTPLHIKPEWYFIGSYQALKLFPDELLGISFQAIFILALFTIPFFDRKEDRHITHNITLFISTLLFIALWVGLTVWGILL
ncbi:MAG: cytochrome b/b6 complex, cytochrome b subunit [Ignavibacteria bacterium]|nr:cytochrome b/b6 complex, cytochrome b subunit [Ignavibacteria bacterium]